MWQAVAIMITAAKGEALDDFWKNENEARESCREVALTRREIEAFVSEDIVRDGLALLRSDPAEFSRLCAEALTERIANN